MITQKKLKKLYSYNEETGKFIRIWVPNGSGKNQCNIGDEVGYVHNDGYLATNIEGKQYRLHRLAFLYVTGRFPEKQVDHINGDRTDNRWENLREVDNTGNMKNQRTPKNNKSGVIGVRWEESRKRWEVNIGVDGKQIKVGRFKNKADAIKARKEAEKKYEYHENHGRPK